MNQTKASRLAYESFGKGALTLAFVLILGHAFYFFNHPLLTYGDQAIYIESARLILAGKAPYLDFWEWNPPLIMYLNVLPVLLAGPFLVNLILSFNLCVLLLCFLTSALALKLQHAHGSRSQFVFSLPIILAAVLFTCVSTISYGEREHLFVLAFLPYFVLRSMRWRKRQPTRLLANLTGFLAGLMLALKPQFFLCAGIVELVLMRHYGFCKQDWKRLFWTAEIKSTIAVVLAYGLGLVLLPSASRDIFFGEILPFYGPGYEFSQRSIMFMLRGDDQILRPVLLSLCGVLAALTFAAGNPRIAALGAFCAVGLFNYFYGNQAWIYRLVPSEFAALLIFVEIGMTVIRRYLVHGARAGVSKSRTLGWQCLVFALTCIGSLYFCGLDLVQNRAECAAAKSKLKIDPGNSEEALTQIITSNTTAGERVLYLGTGISPGYPAILQAGREPGSRYLYSVLPQIEACTLTHKDQAEHWRELLKKHVENYRADIDTNKPALIILQTIPIEGILEKEGLMPEIRKQYGVVETEIKGLTVMKRVSFLK